MSNRRRSCEQCLLLRINGIVCHESGCPLAWRDETRECKECGSNFTPEGRGEHFCCDECFRAYMGLPCMADDTINLADCDPGALDGFPHGWDCV